MPDVAVTALKGECLDALVWRATGSTTAVEAVLAANRDLAAIAQALPAGHQVLIPSRAVAPPAKPLTQLWD